MCFMGHTAIADAVTQTSTTDEMPYADLHETHTGIVVLVANRAFKIKKPIATDFLDFRTVAQREQVCAREVTLNRRLAPDSYLGVAHLSDPTGAPPEPVVVMKRYPDSSRLSALVRRADPGVNAYLTQIAESLAQFHRRADRGHRVEEQGEAAAVAVRWQANIVELKKNTGTIVAADVINEVETLVKQFVNGRSDLFTARMDESRIVDGHGDLLADDIFCLNGNANILDCLEFDDRLRYVDGIDDAAFLAMDLEFTSAKDAADFFLDEYRRFSEDAAPSSLSDFYIAYRAGVRAKVDCIRCSQGVATAMNDAERHLEIALEHLRCATVHLALVGGGPGTGKTTVARSIADQVGAEVISTDAVRRELQQRHALLGSANLLDGGLYSPANTTSVYDEVLRRARLLLSQGRSVILDGTWRNPHERERARGVAAQTHAVMVEILCLASAAVAAERVARRPKGGLSDATPAIANALAFDGAEWSEATVVDTTRELAQTSAVALTLWRDASMKKPSV